MLVSTKHKYHTIEKIRLNIGCSAFRNKINNLYCHSASLSSLSFPWAYNLESVSYIVKNQVRTLYRGVIFLPNDSPYPAQQLFLHHSMTLCCLRRVWHVQHIYAYFSQADVASQHRCCLYSRRSNRAAKKL